MERLKNMTVSDVLDAGLVYSPKGRKEEMVNRICYGMSFCTEGQITYRHNGKEYVSDNGCVVILPQGGSYTLHGDRAGIFPVINFTCTGKFTDEFLLIPSKSTDRFMNDFETIKRLILFPENRAKILSVFYGMIDALISSGAPSVAVDDAIRYMKRNYKTQGITGELVAKVCGISEVYLRKLFVKQLNTTPMRYLSEIRLQRAKQLLSEGILKISSVSEECGFQSAYNFSRFFKEKTGLSPSEYAAQNKNSRL